MSNLWKRFWILSCRTAMRSVINLCSVCKRHKVKRLEIVSSDLSSDRVKDAKVFEVVGIDYLRSLFLRKSQKAWICLFICAAYRAVHL